jgi:hypothetical protein
MKKHMNKHIASLAIKEMQIKDSRFHLTNLTTVKMAIINNQILARM